MIFELNLHQSNSTLPEKEKEGEFPVLMKT